MFLSSRIEADIVETVKEKKVVYQRELQVYLEDKYSHWDVYSKLKNLERVSLGSRSYRGRRRYWPGERDG